jgi:hypothetical protein
MEDRREPLPGDAEALKAALVVERGRRIVAETEAAVAKARASDDQSYAMKAFPCITATKTKSVRKRILWQQLNVVGDGRQDQR